MLLISDTKTKTTTTTTEKQKKKQKKNMELVERIERMRERETTNLFGLLITST